MIGWLTRSACFLTTLLFAAMNTAMTTDLSDPAPPSTVNQQPFLNTAKCCDDLFCSTEFNRLKRCLMCGWEASGPSQRRKLGHLLGKGSSTRACTKRSMIPEDLRDDLEFALRSLDRELQSKRKRAEESQEATRQLALPKRQKKITTYTMSMALRDTLNMSYARMVIMSGSKTLFMESPFTVSFFQVEWILHAQHIVTCFQYHRTSSIIRRRLARPSWVRSWTRCTTTRRRGSRRSSTLTTLTRS